MVETKKRTHSVVGKAHQNMKNLLYRIWRTSLPFIFIVILVHFIKDITQDILKIPSPLDLLGDVQEDLSIFPIYARSIFVGLGISSFFAEAFLLISIPLLMKKNIPRVLEKVVWVILAILFLYFVIATLLDPRFKIVQN